MTAAKPASNVTIAMMNTGFIFILFPHEALILEVPIQVLRGL